MSRPFRAFKKLRIDSYCLLTFLKMPRNRRKSKRPKKKRTPSEATKRIPGEVAKRIPGQVAVEIDSCLLRPAIHQCPLFHAMRTLYKSR